jgi:hypothetical protein
VLGFGGKARVISIMSFAGDNQDEIVPLGQSPGNAGDRLPRQAYDGLFRLP